MRTKMKILSNIRNYCLTFNTGRHFCNTKFVQMFKKERQHMMLDNSFSAFNKYTELKKKAEKQLGINYQQILLKEGLTPPVPGLIYIKQFVSQQELQKLIKNSNVLYSTLVKKQKLSTYTHKSYNHNLSSDKHYKLLNIVDHSSPNSTKLDCQMFTDYGSKNHDLVYFIDNKNIPYFIHQTLIFKLQQLPVAQLLTKQQSSLNWRLTLNVYKQNTAQQQAFLWHKDIAVNGIFTTITSVIGSGYFQIKDQMDQRVIYRIIMVPGSLVVLSGKSRWRWVHRVLRKQQNCENIRGIDDVKRISLVLGCK